MEHSGSNYFYFDIPKEERDAAVSFLLDALIRSRAICQLPSNEPEFDEDVNIYLAHLLFAASLPDYQEAVRRYVSIQVSDVADLIERAEDRVVRYFIYKVNADHLLVHLGIFNDLPVQQKMLGKTERQYTSMAQGYYEQAAGYNHRIYRRQTAVGSVLEKLAHSFHCYIKILRALRKDFFCFSNQFPDHSFGQFCEEINRYERDQKLNETRDLFLDTYLQWRKTKDIAIRTKLEALAGKLKELDLNFQFHLKEEAA